MKLTAAFVPPTEGGFTAFVEEIPGAIAKGETIDGVRENLSVALRTVLKFNRELARKNESVVPPRDVGICGAVKLRELARAPSLTTLRP